MTPPGLRVPAPFPDQALAARPAWAALRPALATFTKEVAALAEVGSEKGCQLPILDPWDSSILPWVSKAVKPNCNCWDLCDDGSRLLFTEMNVLQVNTSALEAAGLVRDQVRCFFTYVGKNEIKQEVKGLKVTLRNEGKEEAVFGKCLEAKTGVRLTRQSI